MLSRIAAIIGFIMFRRGVCAATLECLLNHSWANKRWGEQLPRHIPIDTLGSMVEASDITWEVATKVGIGVRALVARTRLPVTSEETSDRSM